MVKQRPLQGPFGGVNEFTICTIKKKQKGIRASVLGDIPESSRQTIEN